ncbi:MAG: hypothetical protein IK126_06350 [Bacteroidales bacterium]|nr:hypothetical protein [Bacteroidales bacterium]
MRGPPYSGPRFFNPNTVHSVVIICDNRVHPEPAILSPIRPTQIDIGHRFGLLITGKMPVILKTGKVPVLHKGRSILHTYGIVIRSFLHTL